MGFLALISNCGPADVGMRHASVSTNETNPFSNEKRSGMAATMVVAKPPRAIGVSPF
jgi:hypothetical protein